MYFDSEIQGLGDKLARCGMASFFIQLLSENLALQAKPGGLLFVFIEIDTNAPL